MSSRRTSIGSSWTEIPGQHQNRYGCDFSQKGSDRDGGQKEPSCIIKRPIMVKKRICAAIAHKEETK